MHALLSGNISTNSLYVFGYSRPFVKGNSMVMTIPFALLKAQNGMKLFCSPWALLYN
jgi:hypothetical protein